MNRAARLHILILLMVTLSGLATLCHSFGYAAIEDLIDLDLVPNSCDGLITLDTISNREWLDVTEAVDFSYNDLTGPEHNCNPTCTTGPLAGWTLASEQDVLQLMRNAGLSPYGSENPIVASSFRSLLGGVGICYPASYCIFWTEGFTRDLVSETKVFGIRLDYEINYKDSSSAASTSQVEASVEDITLHWLYRISSRIPPEANFCASPTTGLVPLTVDFTDRSYQATSWLWDFGDGLTSTEQHPSHTYTAPETYTVSLTVTRAEGSDTETITDFVTTRLPNFSEAAASEVLASFNFDWSIYNWAIAFKQNPDHYPYMRLYTQTAYDYAEDAYETASNTLNENTTFWGIYSIQYIEAELGARAEALTYIDLAIQYAAAGDDETAEYYGAYGLALSALADFYNGSAIWCCSMEASIEATGQQGTFASSPSFSSAATNGVLANMYFATSLAYIVYVLDDPSYLSLIQLYASTAYDYAEAAYNDASAALTAAGDDFTFWGSYAVQYAASDLDSRSESLSYIDFAVQAYQVGDLESAKTYLANSFQVGQFADRDNASLIWCASMESTGGAK